METTDFARSFITFRIDTLKKPPLTVSHKPPFPLNNARIQVDCRLEVVEKPSGRRQLFLQAPIVRRNRSELFATSGLFPTPISYRSFQPRAF